MTIVFGLIGGGWRAEFYLRIAKELPERFRVSGAVIRDAAKGAAFTAKWNVPTFRTIGELLRAEAPSFVVLSVPGTQTPDLLRQLATLGVPVLAETPPAMTIDALTQLYEDVGATAKIQVAEQYSFQPLHAARLSLAESGLLGTVRHAYLSVAHGYHGIGLLRRLLGVGFAAPLIQAVRFEAPIVQGPGRQGAPQQEQIKPSVQTIAMLQYEGKLGIYDFAGDQYFSWIRSPRWLARGERGEINDTNIKYLKNFLDPVELELKRSNAGENGNLEGYYLKAIFAGERELYRNPFQPGRLSDEEIAIAECLRRMDEYVRGGAGFYSLAEAAQDQYISLMIAQAVESRQPVQANEQIWAN